MAIYSGELSKMYPFATVWSPLLRVAHFVLDASHPFRKSALDISAAETPDNFPVAVKNAAPVRNKINTRMLLIDAKIA